MLGRRSNPAVFFCLMHNRPAIIPLRAAGLPPALQQRVRRCLPLLESGSCENGWSHFDLLMDSADRAESADIDNDIPDLGLPIRLRSGAFASWHHALDPASYRTHELLPPALRICIAQQCARLGAMPLHAACVEVLGECWLLLGSSGAGKSTLTMAALATGNARLVSDDWIMLQAAGDAVWASRLRPFVALRDLPNPGWQEAIEAAIGPLPEVVPGQRQIVPLPSDDSVQPMSLPLTRVLLLSEPNTARPTVTSAWAAAPEQVLEQLIFASVPLLYTAHFPAERNQLMATVKQLLRTTAAHCCMIGRDLLDDPAQVWRGLAELASPRQLVPAVKDQNANAIALMNPNSPSLHLDVLGAELRAQYAARALSFNRLDSGGAVILSLRHGRALSVNPVGAMLIDQLLAGQDDLQALGREVSARFSVAPERALADVSTFLFSLRAAVTGA